MSTETLNPALEVVRYQGKSALFTELTQALEGFMQDRSQWSAIGFDKMGLEAIIKKHTGLKMPVEAVRGFGACVNFYVPDANHPLNMGSYEQDKLTKNSDNSRRKFQDSMPILEKHFKNWRGSINREASKVSGIFSEVPSYMAVGIWHAIDIKLTAAELAAIMIHEIGHVFTYYETLVDTVTLNYALQAALQELHQAKRPELKLEVLFQFKKTGMIDDDKKLVDASDATILTVIAKNWETKMRSATGSLMYDIRSSEFLADQFAARHGSGKDLAMGLDKLSANINYNYGARRGSFVVHVLWETLKKSPIALWTVGALAVMPAAGITVLALMTALVLARIIPDGQETRIYDDPDERVKRIRNDLVQVLKSRDLSVEDRKLLLKDVEQLDELYNKIKQHRPIFDYIWIATTSKRRDQFKQMRIQQDMEKLVNNDLFVMASKFDILSHTK